MLWILFEHFNGYFCFDLLDISFEHGASSLFYILYLKDEDDDNIEIDFEIFYYRQLRILFYKLLEKIIHK
jgi:hypothetical protein